MSDRLCCVLNTLVLCVYCKEKLCVECVFDSECSSELAEIGQGGKKRHGLRVYDQ